MNRIMDAFFQLYSAFLDLNNLVSQIVFLIILYLIFEVIGWIFPAFERLLNFVFLPFRFLHTYAHLFIAHVLSEEERGLPFSPQTKSFPMLRVSLDREDSSSASIRAKDTRSAYKIAMAPSLIATVLFVVFLFSGQILLSTGELIPELMEGDRTALYVVYFIHFYLLLGITRVWASLEDFHFVILTYMTRSQLSPLFLAWTGIVFAVVFTTGLLTSKNIIVSLRDGILSAAIYLFLYILMIAHLSEPQWTVGWARIEDHERQQILETIEEEETVDVIY